MRNGIYRKCDAVMHTILAHSCTEIDRHMSEGVY